jgi:hypothetical protein
VAPAEEREQRGDSHKRADGSTHALNVRDSATALAHFDAGHRLRGAAAAARGAALTDANAANASSQPISCSARARSACRRSCSVHGTPRSRARWSSRRTTKPHGASASAAHLDGAELDDALARGEALDLDQAVELAVAALGSA